MRYQEIKIQTSYTRQGITYQGLTLTTGRGGLGAGRGGLKYPGGLGTLSGGESSITLLY